MIAKAPFAATALALAAPAGAQPTDPRIAALEVKVDAPATLTQSPQDRGEVENLFSRYMYLHNAFHDPEIVPVWVKKGTPDVRAQYSNNGVYTDWDTSCPFTPSAPTRRAS